MNCALCLASDELFTAMKVNESQYTWWKTIMNESAVEKSTGKENKITITNDKGRLSANNIEHMVKEAEQFKTQDEQQRAKIAAKNSLETYAFSMKSTMEEDA
eukprot:Em0012g764a